MIVMTTFLASIGCLGVGLVLTLLGVAFDADFLMSAGLIAVAICIMFLFAAIIAGLIMGMRG